MSRSAQATRIAAELAEPASAIPADGRLRRSQRSGQAIVDAVFYLVGTGILAPTAQQVAARARVGIRTVFRRFSDMESLFAQMDARLQAEALPLFLGGQPKGGRQARALGLVRQRALLFERIAPYKRSATVMRWRSRFLRDRHLRLVRVLRLDLVRWLPELERGPVAVVDAIDLATSFEAWDRLRSEQGLSPARAQAVVEHTVLGLVKQVSR